MGKHTEAADNGDPRATPATDVERHETDGGADGSPRGARRSTRGHSRARRRGRAAARAEQQPPVSREELWEACAELGSNADVLGTVAEAAARAGYAGPTVGLRLTYLAATTRLLRQPVSVVFRGPSAAGKSFTIKQVLSFLPEEAYLELTAMSEKALVYLEQDLSHTMLVIQEGAGLSGDFLTYAVRSLLSEGRLDYLYTDFEHRTTRRIVKEGPTGLITSTAGRLDFELATRVITPNVEDTPELTRAVFRAEARRAQGLEASVDYEPFHALQRLLAAGPREVVIPYAEQLAEKIDDTAVRLRRDFPAILGLLKAHALLQQQQRDRDAAGQVIADIPDYVAVYGLVEAMVAEAAGNTVPASVRETVVAVRKRQYGPPGGPEPDGVTVRQVAQDLGVSRSSASRRMARAVSDGYLVEIATATRGRKLFKTGEQLPADSGVLPPPDTLNRA